VVWFGQNSDYSALNSRWRCYFDSLLSNLGRRFFLCLLIWALQVGISLASALLRKNTWLLGNAHVPSPILHESAATPSLEPQPGNQEALGGNEVWAGLGLGKTGNYGMRDYG
jgi:hypothetical protein